MHILMLCEYFYPFDRGGAEWSAYYLAKGLISRGHAVSILTPNYGAKPYECWQGLSIYRFFFPIKLKKGGVVTPLWYTNGLWIILSSIALLTVLKKLLIDIVHVQGKYFLPAAVLIGKLFKKPLIFSFRDFQVLCPYALCINKKRDFRACSLSYFLQVETKQYYRRYVGSKHTLMRVFSLFTGLRGRLVSSILTLLCRRTDAVVAISGAMRNILSANGIKSLKIYNPMEFSKVTKAKTNLLVYVGRLTWGKGVHLLIPAISPLLKRKRDVRLLIIGEGIVKGTMESQARKEDISRQIKFAGHLPYQHTLQYLAEATLVIVPSVWQEPFGRVALEAISQGTPVVATNRGGLPEIVEDGKTGFIVEPNVKSIAEGVRKAIRENDVLRQNIHASFQDLREKFYYQPIRNYSSLYKETASQ